jgi:predicted nucleic acid-binding protein
VIVVDASALLELLLDTPAGRTIANRIDDPELGLHVPHLVDIEITQALRRYTRKGEIQAEEAEQAIADLRALDLQRHAHEPLLDRVWELRENLTAYDAVYVALAEVLDTIVLTCDRPLARAPGMATRVELVKSSQARRPFPL